MEFFSDELNACRNWMEVINFEINAIGESGNLLPYEVAETARDCRQIDIVFDGLIGCAKAVKGLSLCLEDMYRHCVPWNYFGEEREIRLKQYVDAVASVDDPCPPIHIYNDCT